MRIQKDKKNMSANLSMPSRTIREEAMAVTTAIRGLAQDGYKTIVLDFSQTSMIDSAALGALIHARREFPALAFSVTGATGYVQSVLENARIHTIFGSSMPPPKEQL